MGVWQIVGYKMDILDISKNKSKKVGDLGHIWEHYIDKTDIFILRIIQIKILLTFYKMWFLVDQNIRREIKFS